eukprot:3099284-Alexandrium_andersonii.AAC.1
MLGLEGRIRNTNSAAGAQHSQMVCGRAPLCLIFATPSTNCHDLGAGLRLSHPLKGWASMGCPIVGLDVRGCAK